MFDFLFETIAIAVMVKNEPYPHPAGGLGGVFQATGLVDPNDCASEHKGLIALGEHQLKNKLRTHRQGAFGFDERAAL